MSKATKNKKKSPTPAGATAPTAQNSSFQDYIAPGLHSLVVPIESLTPDPRNARKHGDRNLDSIKKSLARSKQQKPVVADADGIVLAGNGTLAAARALGWTHIAAVVSNLRGLEARAFAISDNRTAELAEWDAEELTAQIEEIADAGIGLDAAGLDFLDEELDQLLKDVPDPGKSNRGGGGSSNSSTGGAGGTSANAQRWGLQIKLADEEQQATALDAIARDDGAALMKVVKAADADGNVRPLVPLAEG